MNVLLWILQIGLALLCLAGGSYKVTSFNQLAKMPATAALPHGVWTGLGVFEMICAVLLIVPAAMKRMPGLTPGAAAALTVEELVLAAIFVRYSREFAATNPLVWAVAIAIVAAFVAYGRFVLRPIV